MPYIKLNTNTTVSSSQADSLKRSFGKLIEIIPGKSEQWLMIHIQDQQKMWFHGGSEHPILFVEIKAFGNAHSMDCYDSLTKEITSVCSLSLHIPYEQIYVEYEETLHWGWNGKNLILKK